jgi:hypothetical protein
MNLIMSGAYLNAEFTAEFGQLPPAFLPVGNKRLYQWQIKALAATGDRVVLALPQDFELQTFDLDVIRDSGVEIVPVPPGLSLGAAVVYCLNVSRVKDEPVRVLHGDTLVDGIGSGQADTVMVAQTAEYYNWAELETGADRKASFREGLPSGRQPRDVLCGYFSFSEPFELIESIVKNDNNFIRGLNAYSERRPLQAVQAASWHDFGHVQTYYQSKSRMTTQRAFNSLQRSERWITKSSTDSAKIAAEAAWYEALPGNVRIFTPSFIGQAEADGGAVAYHTEYLFLSTLSELYVFGKLPTFVWNRILSRCDEFLRAAREHRSPEFVGAADRESYRAKTLERLEVFARANPEIGLDTECRYAGKALPSLRQITEICASAIPDATRDDMTLWHGDFCFSNIFYDFRAEQVRTIDPRGRDFLGRSSIYGDRRYDIAKLTHSIVGRYDFIISGHCKVEGNGPLDLTIDLPNDGALRELETQYLAGEISGYKVAEPWVMAMTVTLFLSMLPLHDDNPRRQRAMLANALRLFSGLAQ